MRKTEETPKRDNEKPEVSTKPVLYDGDTGGPKEVGSPKKAKGFGGPSMQFCLFCFSFWGEGGVLLVFFFFWGVQFGGGRLSRHFCKGYCRAIWSSALERHL